MSDAPTARLLSFALPSAHDFGAGPLPGIGNESMTMHAVLAIGGEPHSADAKREIDDPFNR